MTSRGSNPDPAPRMTAPRKKILLIDDDESILLAVSRVLTVSGFDVVSAPGGVSGLEMVVLDEKGTRAVPADDRL